MDLLGKRFIIVVSSGGLASEEEQNKNINDREEWRSFSDIQLLLRLLSIPLKYLKSLKEFLFFLLLADGLLARE